MASNQALQNNSIIVVSPQYCTPYQVDLYIAKEVKQVTQHRYLGAFDINGNNIFKVKTNGFFSSRLILIDANGVPVVSLKPSTYLLVQRWWKVYRGDSKDSKDLLCTVHEIAKTQDLVDQDLLGVFLASTRAGDVCDFKIKQSDSKKSCIIYLGNSDYIIAEMHKNEAVRDKVRGEDIYSLTVSPNVDYAFVVTMLAVLDEFNTPPISSGGGGMAGAQGGWVGGGGGVF